MAYFGDATAHAAVLGVALALATDLPVGLGTLVVALAMAVTVARLVGARLGDGHHAGGAGPFRAGLRACRGQLLAGGAHRPFGLSLRRHPGGVAAGPCSGLGRRGCWSLGLLVWRWQALLTATLSEDLAHAAGLNPDRERLVLVLALAVVVAVALKVVGALLIAAMLIIPAAAARGLARTPEAMAAAAVLIGAVASLGGLAPVAVAGHPDRPVDHRLRGGGLRPVGGGRELAAALEPVNRDRGFLGQIAEGRSQKRRP